MIDLSKIEKYRENNRIEAKRASGGFPGSVWETYSAFANTLGGIILLGVEELKDKSFHLVDLKNAEALAEEFRRKVSDTRYVSANILKPSDVSVEEIDGKRIVAITVPRARRQDKPIYIDKDPYSGSYRRNGEGDYRCTRDEIDAMIRDAAIETDDMRRLDGYGASALKLESLERFLGYDVSCDTEILKKLGVVDNDERLSLAGLMMFGCDSDIKKQLPNFSLTYKGAAVEYSAENICDLLFFVLNRFQKRLESLGIAEQASAQVFAALKEALVNCLVNADYRIGGIVVEDLKNEIRFLNPGGFRIDINGAKSGGVSDPRNRGLIKIITYVGSAKGSGSGIPGIYTVWRANGWREPNFEELFSPDRTVLTLSFEKRKGRASASKSADAIYRDMIISHLTRMICASASEVARATGISRYRASRLLNLLVEEGIAVIDGSEKAKKYKLKA